MTAEFEP